MLQQFFIFSIKSRADCQTQLSLMLLWRSNPSSLLMGSSDCGGEGYGNHFQIKQCETAWLLHFIISKSDILSE